ncbi:MAG: hypothetical protein ACP5N3_03010 [Candidatus Nanoarchaeia archaeon]
MAIFLNLEVKVILLMEKDAILYKKVRDLFERDKSESQILKALAAKGYPEKEVLEMIAEYRKDEANSVDDELVETVEHLFDEGKNMDEIYSYLSKANHPFEVKKAMLRANLVKFDYKAYFFKSLKSINIILIFVAEILLAFFVNSYFWFLIPMLIITLCLYYVYKSRKGKIDSQSVSAELNKMNVEYSYIGGIHITQGAWGWNPHTGVYPRFWLFNLGIIFLVIHLVFALLMLIFGFTEFFFSVLLGLFSFASLYYTHERLV